MFSLSKVIFSLKAAKYKGKKSVDSLGSNPGSFIYLTLGKLLKSLSASLLLCNNIGVIIPSSESCKN